MPIVQFALFSSLVQLAFWLAHTDFRIDVLSDNAVTTHGLYADGRSVKDCESGAEIALGSHSALVTGVFKNYNTVEHLKAADKTALFAQVTDEYCYCHQATKAARALPERLQTSYSSSLLPRYGVRDRDGAT
ncbi:uncharacterized protein B0H18DRAFT_957615 [Fomitopsis serialis]|uniref:uncharacterized protein n=1 Tax=Fomitopsis serialis TaxID=139415 RepID=UPI002007AAE9|nr:uncharacterized protein B0H18DRAFT_957604 [Neoantrodia serialis]XP_047889407.1 uncharacterized protein B0H18DRAFT_957615 [Neoantrodia serialis]KAH9919224.1 hypothetical protein B0H18DRAFT_957604 [Neoantrodia serialis]KAH9919249.1 hypothetical protein B0H18DRAFT_957615 [Neoantrodia serialis]